MCTPGTPFPEPASPAGALAAVRAGLRYLATVTAADLTAAEQADCLRGLAAAESAQLAAAASMLAAFEHSGGYAADGQISGRAWLRWQTRISHAAAGQAAAWTRRLAAHPAVHAALAAGTLSPSYARQVCDWTGQLPGEHQAAADQILLDAAAGGADTADLAGLAEEIRRRVARPDPDGTDDAFTRRWLRLTRHYRGHARLDGDLTPAALIHQTSRGYPRAINNIAVAALLAAFTAGKAIADESSARAAVTEVTTE